MVNPNNDLLNNPEALRALLYSVVKQAGGKVIVPFDILREELAGLSDEDNPDLAVLRYEIHEDRLIVEIKPV